MPNKKGKAQQIVELYGAQIMSKPPTFEDVTPDQAIICVVDNGPYEAAGFAYSQEELWVFTNYDGRPRTWLTMDRKLACELTGFKEV